MDLSSEQARYLHTVLDKGIDSLTVGEFTAETPTLQGIPASALQSSRLYQGSPAQTPNLSFAESPSLLGEVQTLQDKFAYLESLLQAKSSTQRLPTRPPSQHRTTSRSPSHTAERLYHEIEKSEKELERHSKSALKSPERHSSSANSVEIGRLRSELAEERRKYAAIQRENANLRQKLTLKEDLQARLAALQEDYNALSVSFDKSESIRTKQKDLIEQLKRETEDKSLFSLTNSKKTGAKKPGKAVKSS